MSKVPQITTIDKWRTPASEYPKSQVGNFRIRQVPYKQGLYHNWGVNDVDYFHTDGIKVTILEEHTNGKWHTWMVDDPPHWWSMQRYAAEARGRVLVAGLGLGLFLHALSPRVHAGDVSSIIVVERSPDVIELVRPLVPHECLDIRTGDFYDYYRHAADFDFALIDLWVTNGSSQKEAVFNKYVMPLWANMRFNYPAATLVFHGFTTVSDVRLWSEGFKPDVLEDRR